MKIKHTAEVDDKANHFQIERATVEWFNGTSIIVGGHSPYTCQMCHIGSSDVLHIWNDKGHHFWLSTNDARRISYVTVKPPAELVSKESGDFTYRQFSRLNY